MLWRSELADGFPTVAWTEATDGATGQLKLYQLLRDYGIVQVDGIGTEPDATDHLAGLLGPIHETTVYGRIYDVRAEPVAKLGAKTGMAQAVHIDDAFYYSQPGIDIFHCLVNTTEGGMSTYVDGFAVAQTIATEDPAAYELLTTVAIPHIRRHPGEIDLRNRGPLISLDEFGEPSGIRYFDRALAPLDCSPELIGPMYDAIRAFNRRIVDPAFIAEIRVPAGNGMLIDNHRVMHGRTAFDPSSGRHIRLCHVPRDEFHGRLRELSRQLDPASHDLHLPQGSQNL
jgi:alpha-ketoglutarate-dependent taurine dioxygenase